MLLWLGLASCRSSHAPRTADEPPVATTAVATTARSSPGPACGPSPGPTLAADRSVTAAVALDDGTVLLAGAAGRTPRPWSALLDPRTGAVTEVEMLPDRFAQRLVRTTDGNAIAVAGRRPGEAVTASARFELATHTWHALPALPACVSDDVPALSDQHRATVEMAALSDGGVLVLGHRCAARLTSVGAWVQAPSPPPARGFTLTQLAQGDLLRVGGLRTAANDADLEATREVYRFALADRRWTSVAASPYYRYHHATAVLRDGRLLVVGGCEDSGTICGAENTPAPPATIYDPVADRWMTLGGGPVTDRERATATVMADGRVVMLGGFGNGEEWGPTPSAVYDNGRWAELPGLGRGGGQHLGVATGDHILIAGGMWKEHEPPLLWYGAAPSCPTTPVALSPPAPPVEESMP